MLDAFRAQIERGGPVTVTHPEVTRFFMTIPEACELVLQAGAIGQPGDVLVLDMGEPIRIIDVATRLIDESRQSIEIEFSGLRQGEKLHEVLLSAAERGTPSRHPLITQVSVPPLEPIELLVDDAGELLRSQMSTVVPGGRRRRHRDGRPVSAPLGDVRDAAVAVVGLGYVGLPLAVEFGRTREVIGYDIDSARVKELGDGHDHTLEVPRAELAAASRLRFTDDPADLAPANVYIVTTPTPIDEHKQPDLTPVLSATEAIARTLASRRRRHLRVHRLPGSHRGALRAGARGRSPASPSTATSTSATARSGSTPATASTGCRASSRSPPAPPRRSPTSSTTSTAPSSPPARTAPRRSGSRRPRRSSRTPSATSTSPWSTSSPCSSAGSGIDTEDVLLAAGSKWNFLRFRPGLVGGHCIGVDPYYLTHKAQAVGYHPEIILAGRRLNDSMGGYVASQLVKRMTKDGIRVQGARVLVLGLTFKENTPDLRNSRVVDVIRELEDYDIRVDVLDPWANPQEAKEHYGVDLVSSPEPGAYAGIVLAVAHRQFVEMGAQQIRALGTPGAHVLYDLKYVLDHADSDLRL